MNTSVLKMLSAVIVITVIFRFCWDIILNTQFYIILSFFFKDFQEKSDF
jgi:hypothetical protein